MTKLESRIIGLGSYLPKTELYNKEFEKFLDTNDEWIRKRTGIVKRHVVSPGELTSDMAVVAAKKAMYDAKIEPNDVDMIVVATTTADMTFPGCATIVQSKLGCKNAFAFDVQAVCSGFIYGLATANNFIKSGDVKTVLLIGADSMSKIIDYSDRSTAILFGDGAGAVVIQTSDDTESFIKTKLYSDGEYQDILYTDGGVSSSQNVGNIIMEGQAVFEHAIKKMLSATESILRENNYEVGDIDLFIPHQANDRIIQSIAKRLAIGEDKIISTVDIHANTSAASIPLAWDHAWQDVLDVNDKLVMLVAIGAGLTWGSALIKL
ncbi:MAG: ketoacyl-ACP synthase III [Rickettsiaceae bacterium H1]|nr:ketoacyl-ACP synthase III [Rickettsiaceae bacterium H1]